MRALVLVLSLCVAAPAAAQDAPIELEVGEREARAIDVEALRGSIARELGVEVRLAGGATIELTRVRVRAIGRARAVLELRRPDGSRMQRSTELHRDPAERLETIVILAVNMVRDEASELLEMLRSRRAIPVAAITEPPAAEAAAETLEAATSSVAPPQNPMSTLVTAMPQTDSESVVSVVAAVSAANVAVPPAQPAAEEPDLPRPPGPRFLRIGLSGLGGSVPVGRGFDGTLIGGLEVAWTHEFLAIGVRDVGGGAPLASTARWMAGATPFAELAWVLDPVIDLHLQLGADVRAITQSNDVVAGVAPMLLVGARFFPLREFSIALQTALHVVATDVWSTNLHVLPQGAVLWTVGLAIAGHVS